MWTHTRTGNGMPIDWQRELERHDRWLRSVAWSRLRSTLAVDEVMQEVALAAVRQQAPIADANRVGAWLHRLAVTHSLLYRRRMGRQRRLEQRFAQRLMGEENTDVDPLGYLLSQERRAMVRRAMAMLAPRDAELLLLKYVESFSYQKMSAVLEISEAAVESRLHRARQKLRTALAAIEGAEIET